MQAAKLKHQLSYEQRRNLKKYVEAAEAELEKIRDNLQRLQGQADAAAEASATLEADLSAEVSTHGPLLSPFLCHYSSCCCDAPASYLRCTCKRRSA